MTAATATAPRTVGDIDSFITMLRSAYLGGASRSPLVVAHIEQDHEEQHYQDRGDEAEVAGGRERVDLAGELRDFVVAQRGDPLARARGAYAERRELPRHVGARHEARHSLA